MPRDYPAKRARLGQGRGRQPKPPLPTFAATCGLCGWEGQAVTLTCPECSGRLQGRRAT